MKGKFFLAVVVCLLLSGIAAAQNDLKVAESKTQIFLSGTTAKILLVVEAQNENDGDGESRISRSERRGGKRLPKAILLCREAKTGSKFP